jgi:hypothetical protein
MKTKEKRNTESTEVGAQRTPRVTPGGNADGCENEGVGGEAIGKSMKTKGGKIDSK